MNQKQFQVMLKETEVRLRRLQNLYDLFFQGLERLEPQMQLKDVQSRLNTMRHDQPRNTAMRFKFTQLQQRLITYNTRWKRITKQIEEGTY